MFRLFSFSALGTIFAFSLMVNTTSAQVIVAGWDAFGQGDNTDNANIPAVDGAITLQPDVSDFSPDSTYSFSGDVLDVRANQRGSNDGTFGSAIEGADNPDANPDHDSLRILQGVVNGIFFSEREMLLNITAADDLDFSTFHIDAGNNPSPVGDTYSDVTVSFINAAGVETILPNDSEGGNRSLLNIPGPDGDGSQSSATGNWLDLDFDVSGLSLAAGESGAFRLRFFDTNPNDLSPPPTLSAAVHLDNIAITVVESTADVSGDFDGNGVVDCADLDGYIGSIGASVAGSTGLANLDFDSDGTISEEDADQVLQTLVVATNGITGTFLGDFNCDGTVDVLSDAFALVGSLGQSVTSYSDGDANFDGTVDILGDAFALVANLGETNETTMTEIQ